jgi:transcriptional regulator with XRE-family HTH domain
MGRTKLELETAARQRAVRGTVAAELRRVREDEGLSIRAVSRGARLHHSHLARAEVGQRSPTIDALVALAAAMGHDVSVRLFAATGPRVRDHVQVRMIEALLQALHPRWTARLEVPVYRPARGVIDVLLQDRETTDLVAGEGHSQVRAVERQLRWAATKADSLPSATGWPFADTLEPPRVSRLLLLRSCAANHDLVRQASATLQASYSADTRDAVEALTTAGPRWPGAAIVWVDLRGVRSTVLHGLPRALR